MKIQKFKVTVLDWDVQIADYDDFEECSRSGSIKPTYINDLAEDEVAEKVIPRRIEALSGWTPSRWTSIPITQKAS